MQVEVMGKRYQLQDPIGRGGMATIYRGRDLRMDRVVAIKVLREIYSTDAKFVARFQQEARAASALQHPNIVQVYDYGQTEGNYYIVMELVEGTDLRRYLRGRGVLDVDRSVIIAHDIALGLGAAHRRNIVHRDVKPQNILVGRDGSIKLTDFGIASVYKDIDPERLTTTGMTLGTVQYFAPEQAQGEIVSPAADVYALGIVMYEMLTGRPPFDGDNPVAVAMQHIQDPPTPPRQLNSTIPPALEEMILRCLEKVPEMRFRDGSQLARAFEMLGDAQLDESVPVTPGQAATPTTSNHIPSRPGNSGRDGTLENAPPGAPASSPENGVSPGVPSDQNDADLVPGSLVNQPVYPNQQSFAPPPGSDTAGDSEGRPQGSPLHPTPLPPLQRYAEISPAVSGSVASYRFRRGTVPRSGLVQPGQRNLRFASIITIPILLATIVLLLFSVYLAVRLGFITLPFINSTGASTPTISVVYDTVPDLRNLDWSDALTKATRAGFHLKSSNGTSGIVIRQSYNPNDEVPQGETIYVTMGPEPAKTATIPPFTGTTTLASYEALLQSDGFHNFITKPDGVDPNLPPNTVSRVNPTPGTAYDVKKLVTIYVKNDTFVTPVASPAPSPTAKPSPTPSPTPKPDPTPSPTPSPTPGLTPSPTPKPDPTPSPTAFKL